MRPRWHDWVIVISIIVIGVAGATAIWGDDVLRLFRDVSRDQPGEAPGEPGGPTPAAEPPAPPVDIPPGGTPI